MKTLQEITQQVLRMMPEVSRFSEEDAETFGRHRQWLATLRDDLVRGFFDTLYGSGASVLLSEEERPIREKSFGQWWERTVSGPFDEDYWNWQTFVGLLHIKRKVPNALMLAMWGWILNFLTERITEGSALSETERTKLLIAFHRLAATSSALIAESVFHFYLNGIEEAAGFNRKLLDRLVEVELGKILEKNAHMKR